ncbi:ESPR-type extended signal peptide-containing protein [Acinetobacter sp. ABJ_C3_5]|uniref:ESPR-type extended signal peptide-containing protein n=1 Tax=Acinetobacter courvalinii TaxID=280147 RepID=UPI0037CC6582
MNKIYRLVWNKSLNLWTVVSENARGVTKKRNVTANTDVHASTLVQADLKQQKSYQPITTVLALTISSVLWSAGAFAATNTGGGSVSNSNGSSMAISPTASQCGTGSGEASVNGNGGVAIGCGSAISGTDTTFNQGLVNRRGTGSNNVPATGTVGVTGASTAVGRNNKVSNAGGATVVGNSNVSNGSGAFQNVMIGQGNLTAGDGYNTALGIGNEISSGNSSTAVGVNNRATGNTAIAMGRGTWADADYSIAQGNTATVASGATSAIAMGHSATAKGVRGIAIGSSTSTAVNYDPATAANADGADSVAVGTGAKATGNQTTAIGRQAAAAGANAAAYGNEAKATGASSVAMGDKAQAQAARGTALGANAVATNADDVALGSNSQTSTATGTAYRTGTAAPSSVVSVGTAGNERRIQNVSAGAADTDAVNVSQLRSVQDGVDQLGQTTAGALGGGSSYDPSTGAISNPTYTVNGNNVNNVGAAISELDKGWNLQSNGANSGAVKAGDTVDIGTADGEENLQVAKEGNNIKYSLNRDLKVDSVTAGDTLINTDGMTIAGGPSVTKAGISAGNKKITNVAPGTVSADSTDAINGSQLHAQGEGVKNIIGGNTQYDPNTGKYTNPDIGGTGKDNINDAIGAVGDAAKAAKSTVSNKDGNITVNETTKADGSRDYEVGLAKDIKVDSVTAGGTKVDGDGLHIDGGPSVTKDGIDAGDKKVTGVADGTVAKDSKDAVNGGQLHAQGEGVKDIIGGNTTYDPNTGKYTNTDIGGTGENNINDAIQSVKNDAKAAKTSVSNTDNNLTINKTTKTDGSTDYEVGLADKIKVKQVDADQVNVAGDQGKTSISGGGISITGPKGEQGPSMTTGGINAGGKKVTGVADGAIAKDSKDAINGSQLHQSYQDVGAALGGGTGYDPAKGWTGPSYEVGGAKHDNVGDALGALDNADKALGDRITNLGDQMQQAFYDTNQRIDDVKKHANAGVAAAMALETAPYISGKYTYAVGAAYHGGENAVGVTLRKTADNGRWSLTTGVAAASQGDPSFRVGLSGVFD